MEKILKIKVPKGVFNFHIRSNKLFGYTHKRGKTWIYKLPSINCDILPITEKDFLYVAITKNIRKYLGYELPFP